MERNKTIEQLQIQLLDKDKEIINLRCRIENLEIKLNSIQKIINL